MRGIDDETIRKLNITSVYSSMDMGTLYILGRGGIHTTRGWCIIVNGIGRLAGNFFPYV